MQILISTANENGWEICQFEENIFVAKIPENYFPAVWGMQVTVLIDKNLILLNSICDPEKRSTVTSYGKNKKNISLLISKLTGNIKSN